MRIVLQNDSGRAIYEQIAEQIKDAIMKGGPAAGGPAAFHPRAGAGLAHLGHYHQARL